jgi:hypothetical protein
VKEIPPLIKSISGQPVRFQVNEINLSSSPSNAADVTIEFGCDADNQCGTGNEFACTINTCNPSTDRCEETQPTTCNFNAMCSMLPEDARTCPSDCGVTSELITEDAAGNSRNGFMFYVFAKMRFKSLGLKYL